ncbi:MAG TPA: hypothetical protein VG733_08195 [Chthoniobacteraceae bacterium]|nr:hypothetical protein [Chthoniobacteraceae bacterium]
MSSYPISAPKRIVKFCKLFAFFVLRYGSLFIIAFVASVNFSAHSSDALQLSLETRHTYVKNAMINCAPAVVAISYLLASLFGYGVGLRNIVANGLPAIAIYYFLASPVGIQGLRSIYDAQASASHSAPAQSSAPMPSPNFLPTPLPHYILKKPVQVQNANGFIVIPANTEIHVIGDSGTACRVSGLGIEFDVSTDQIQRVQR